MQPRIYGIIYTPHADAERRREQHNDTQLPQSGVYGDVGLLPAPTLEYYLPRVCVCVPVRLAVQEQHTILHRPCHGAQVTCSYSSTAV